MDLLKYIYVVRVRNVDKWHDHSLSDRFTENQQVCILMYFLINIVQKVVFGTDTTELFFGNR